MKKTLIFKVILVCSFCVMLFSIFNIVTWCVDSKKTKEVTEKIEEMTKVSVVKDSKFLSVDFDELSKVNDEVVAWVQVLDTNVNYPIVKHSNNSYYLNHSYDKSWNSSGWPFLDYRKHINDLDNLITVCKDCHMKIHTNKLPLNIKGQTTIPEGSTLEDWLPTEVLDNFLNQIEKLKI